MLIKIFEILDFQMNYCHFKAKEHANVACLKKPLIAESGKYFDKVQIHIQIIFLNKVMSIILW